MCKRTLLVRLMRQLLYLLVNSYQNHPDLARSRPLCLSVSRCNTSSVEAGVAVSITRHGETPPVGGMHYHRQRASPTREVRPRLLNRRLLIDVLVVLPPPVGLPSSQEHFNDSWFNKMSR
ncbi:hypothetical protein AVEN_152930-1 [Araneus ventricosus]|uniref:Secreted protein n=1 Tax=Araneus ventricosus TaxID=182803 RepID=A0A4Y2ACY2_ARAVE|nr:hypothetical protein AVEN_152930-1 [Araneus ventricosus]